MEKGRISTVVEEFVSEEEKKRNSVTVPISITVPEYVLKKIDMAAREKGYTRSKFITQLIIRSLGSDPKIPSKTKQSQTVLYSIKIPSIIKLRTEMHIKNNKQFFLKHKRNGATLKKAVDTFVKEVLKDIEARLAVEGKFLRNRSVIKNYIRGKVLEFIESIN